MIISVRGGTKFQNALVREVVEYFHKKCMINYSAIQIDIRLSKNLEEELGVYGFCSLEKTYRPREFEIELEKNMTHEDLIKTLFHELVHVKQYATGELVESGLGFACRSTKWKDKDHSKTPYSKQPWERQAFRLQEKLYTEFMKGV